MKIFLPQTLHRFYTYFSQEKFHYSVFRVNREEWNELYWFSRIGIVKCGINDVCLTDLGIELFKKRLIKLEY
jgi:hypothetical protein